MFERDASLALSDARFLTEGMVNFVEDVHVHVVKADVLNLQFLFDV